MASIINASTSGAGGLIQTADSSGVLALQAAGTTIASVSSTGVAVTGTIADSTSTLRPLVSGTAQASTSGTVIDFTGIPSWVKRITVMFNAVSTSGTSIPMVQIGTSGVIQATSYTSVAAVTTTAPTTGGTAQTTGFGITSSGAATFIFTGTATLTLLDNSSGLFTFNYVGALTGSQSGVNYAGGSKTLSGTLDRVRITTANGTDTFDAGSINIMYE